MVEEVQGRGGDRVFHHIPFYIVWILEPLEEIKIISWTSFQSKYETRHGGTCL